MAYLPGEYIARQAGLPKICRNNSSGSHSPGAIHAMQEKDLKIPR